MRVLVAGGAGYIGSVVTAALLSDGHEVTVLDDLSTGHADAVPSGATLAEVSLHDSAQLLSPSTPGQVAPEWSLQRPPEHVSALVEAVHRHSRSQRV